MLTPKCNRLIPMKKIEYVTKSLSKRNTVLVVSLDSSTKYLKKY